MLLPAIIRSAGLVYYVQCGRFGDFVILAILLVWKTGCYHLASIIAANFGIITVSVLVTAICILFFPLVQSYAWKAAPSSWTGFGRPLLFACRTSHAGQFPKEHSEYSNIFVGVPVGWSGIAGGLISVDGQVPGPKAWYPINAANYLLPGTGYSGLRGKLDKYLASLASHGIEALHYPYAYLVTTTGPAVYGCSPVSFWYLYSAEKLLLAIIAEVSNQFDKKQLHFLARREKNIESVDSGSRIAVPTLLAQAKAYQKDLHRYSFNSRDGVCSLLACDPLSSDIKSPQPINSTIDLVFSNGHTNLVTRITSTGEAIGPTQLPFMQKLIVVFRCLWIRLAAFTRISKEVAALVFGRGFDVREYLGLSTEAKSRYANETERGLEAVFRSYLRHLVRQSPLSLSVRYIPDGVPYVSDELMLSIAAEGKPDTAAHLEFKVLTPAFYPRFVHYAHDFEAMFCELNEHRTIWLSEPTLLPKLVLKKPPPPLTTESYIDYGYFTAIKRLRKLPKKIEWPPASRQTAPTQSLRDIRGFRLSSMDGYVLAHEEDKIRYMYRHLVLRLFIADRIAYGNTCVLSLVTLPLRLLLAWAAVSPG